MGAVLVGTLLMIWLLRGYRYCRMFSGVLVIEEVGSAFIFLCCMSQ